MAEFTPRDLVACIRYEFQRGNPFCEALKNFCQVFGNDAMTFGKFEFWWYRFKEGNFDLDYKGPPKPELSDIPLDIVEEIIKKMEWNERCLFRKVSKKCRQVVDSVRYTFDEIDFHSGTKDVEFHIDDIHVTYHRRRKTTRYFYSHVKLIKAEDFSKRAFTDFMCILKNPKIRIKSLRIRGNFNRINDELKTLLQSLPHRIHVERLIIGNPYDYKATSGNEELLTILPYLKPGILTDIIMYVRENSLSIDILAKMDQWKQVKRFETGVILPKNFEHIKHFHRLVVCFEYISAEDLIQLTNIFSNSPNFQSAIIGYLETEEDVIEKLTAKGFNFDDKNVSIRQTQYCYEFLNKNISC